MNINEVLKSDYDLLCKDYKKATKKIEKQDNEIKSLKEQLELLVKDDEKYQETIIKQSKEIERLNNIINELEKFLKISSEKDDYDLTEYNKGVNNTYNYILDKLKELKGSDSNE